jgi:hypothetical protein
LQTMCGVGGTQLARLHHECDETSSQSEEKEGVTQPTAKTIGHIPMMQPRAQRGKRESGWGFPYRMACDSLEAR